MIIKVAKSIMRRLGFKTIEPGKNSHRRPARTICRMSWWW